MKLLKNKLFISIVTIIVFLFSLQFYFISNSYKRDTNSYVTLIEGAGTLTQGATKKVLVLQQKEKLNNGDVINTLKDSLALIEWGDKSITRLGGNTKIKVKENFVGEDLSKINISFELLKGKTWSNVVSLLTGESHFIQEINGTSAAVRGTVFEANYDQDYLIVHKHEVQLTNKDGEQKKVYQGQAFSLQEFSLEKVLQVVDETFTKLNQDLDKEYLNTLRAHVLEQMKNTNPLDIMSKYLDPNKKVYDMLVSAQDKQTIDSYIQQLPEDQKQKVLSTLQTLNQTLTFENGENSFLYNLKLNTKGLLLDNLNDTAYSEALVKYSVYDISDVLSLGKINDEILKNTYQLLGDHKQYLQNIQTSLEGGNYDFVKDLLNVGTLNFDADALKQKVLEFNQKSQDMVQDTLNQFLDIYKK